MILRIYTLVNIILTPFLVLLVLFRTLRKKEDSNRIMERFGLTKKRKPKRKIIWLHAASVGETLSVIPLLEVLQRKTNYSILLTSGTITSSKVLRNRLPKNTTHQFIPIENYFAIKNFLNHWKPEISIFTESEFWPCILNETSKKSKLISLNTRISDASFERWKSYNMLFKEISYLFSLFLPQSAIDSKRLKSLGAKNVKYIGNIKYSVPSPVIDDQKLLGLQNSLKSKKVVLFASTHPKEEEIIVEIYQELKEKHDSLAFIIAPRHPHRGVEIAKMITKAGYKTTLRSKSKPPKPETEFYIVNSIGEMGLFFRVSPISVMCGSFVNVGGHNPIEPAKLKSAIIMGPHYNNFKEICKDLKKNKAAIFVKNKRECAKAVNLLLSDKQTSRKYIYNAVTFINSKEALLKDVFLEIRKHLK